MINHKLYINPWDTPEYKHSLDATFKGVSEHHDVVFDINKHKTKRSDVPPMYRRNIKHDAINIAVTVMFVLAVLNCILFFAAKI